MLAPNGTATKRVFPIAPHTKTPFERLLPLWTNPESGKTTRSWKPFCYRDPTPDEILAWNQHRGPLNWAVVVGRDSGFCVLDVDVKNGADPILGGRPVPRTLIIATPHSGFHYYFRYREGLKNSPNLARDGFPDLHAVELRYEGLYCLVPPSVVDGRAYEIVVDELPAPLPDWLSTMSPYRPPGPKLYVESLASVPKGQQRHHLLSLMGYLLKMPEATWSLIPRFVHGVAQTYDQNPLDPWTLADVEMMFANLAAKEKQARTRQFPLRPINVPPEMQR